MILPSAAQILRTVEATLADVVEPAAQGIAARSALATIGHLLRHVALRIEHEGQVLADDIAASSALLRDLALYLASAGDHAQLAGIGAVLARSEPEAGHYPSLEIMGARAAALRQAVQDMLVFLQERRAGRAEDPAYRAARAAIRDYLAAEVRAEATLIHPAFEDRGPRR